MSADFDREERAVAARAWSVEEAIHNGEMAGVSVDSATRADAYEYIAGRIDSADLVARTRARYGLK